MVGVFRGIYSPKIISTTRKYYLKKNRGIFATQQKSHKFFRHFCLKNYKKAVARLLFLKFWAKNWQGQFFRPKFIYFWAKKPKNT
jgi:hypothetical protein